VASPAGSPEAAVAGQVMAGSSAGVSDDRAVYCRSSDEATGADFEDVARSVMQLEPLLREAVGQQQPQQQPLDETGIKQLPATAASGSHILPDNDDIEQQQQQQQQQTMAMTAEAAAAVALAGDSSTPVQVDDLCLSLSALEEGEAWMVEDLEVGHHMAEAAAAVGPAATVGQVGEAAAAAGWQASAAASGQQQEEEQLLQQSLAQNCAQQQQVLQPLVLQQPKQQQGQHHGRGPQQEEEEEEEQLLEFAMPASGRSTLTTHAAAEDEFSADDDLPEQPQAQVRP